MGWTIAEYPELDRKHTTIGTSVRVRGVPEEERLVLEKAPLHIPDVAACEGLEEVRDALLYRDIRSILIMPLVIQDRVIASLSIDMIGQTREFSDEEIELFRQLTNQAAVAYRNAIIHEAVDLGHKDASIQMNGMVHALKFKRPAQVLQQIVDTNLAARAWRSLVLIIDNQGQVIDRAAAGFEVDLEEASRVRPDGCLCG
jgi:GAF domain-containing protein